MRVQYDSLAGPHFFKFKNMYYTDNTMVIFTEEFMKEKGLAPETKYGKFTYGNMSNGNNIFHTFKKNKYGKYVDSSSDIGYVVIKDWELESAIEDITKDMVYPCVIAPIPNRKGYTVPGVWALWGVYLVLMFLSMVFKDFASAWVILTVIFLIIRHTLIKNAD